MDQLVKPYSEYWITDQSDYLGEPLKQKIIKLGKGSTFENKIMMLGIVEATFGGQKGYLN